MLHSLSTAEFIQASVLCDDQSVCVWCVCDVSVFERVDDVFMVSVSDVLSVLKAGLWHWPAVRTECRYVNCNRSQEQSTARKKKQKKNAFWFLLISFIERKS